MSDREASGDIFAFPPPAMFVVQNKQIFKYDYDDDGLIIPDEQMGGFDALRFAIMKKLASEESRRMVIDVMTVPRYTSPPGTFGAGTIVPIDGNTSPVDQKERRRKIAHLQPFIFTYRHHRPEDRELKDHQPRDSAIDVGLICDYEFPEGGLFHVHGQNRSTIVWDMRRENPFNEDGVDSEEKDHRNYSGRVHDFCKVILLPDRTTH